MRITIQERPVEVGWTNGAPIMSHGDVYDVSHNLVADTEIELTQERERDAFERVVSDLQFELSNMKDYAATVFSNYRSPNYWDVNIYDAGRRLFWGLLSTPLTKKFVSKSFNVRAFSIDRAWINLSQITYLPAWRDTGEYYTTVEEILNRVMIGDGRPLTQIGVTEISVDDVYKNRPIRDSRSSADPKIGNAGKFGNLDPTMTVKELLDAFAVYYNAEFLVDPESGKFLMKQRKRILTDTCHDLDSVILDSPQPEQDDTDQKKYDYIKLSIGVEKPGAATSIDKSIPVDSGTDVKGKMSVVYQYTNVVQYGSVLIESEPSDPFVMEYELMGLFRVIKLPIFQIPQPPAGTVRQNIYRLRDDEWFELYTSVSVDSGLLLDIDPKFTFNFAMLQEWTPIDQSGKVGNDIANRAPTGNVYMRYDEIAGNWDADIYEQGGTPEPKDGTIFEVNPKLRFVDGITRSVKRYNLVEVFYFFGQEMSIDAFKAQWIELFLMRPITRCTAKGTHYKYGDSFVSSKKIPGKYVVKKAFNRFMKKETQLELLSA
jgi:hypothetical protein